MNGLTAFLDRTLVPIAAKLGAQRHLVAIRDGFMALMPLMIIGSFAILINNFPVDAFQDFMKSTFGETWKGLGGIIWNGTFAISAIILVFSLAYNLGKYYKVDGLSAGVIALATFMIFAPQEAGEFKAGGGAWGIQLAWLGTQGFFVAILVAIITTEIFRYLTQKNFTIKMPDGVPPAVARSFASLLPAFVILVIAAAIQFAIGKVAADASIFKFIFDTLQKPLQGFGNTLPAAFIFMFLEQFFWFFGIHGGNLLDPILSSIYLPALTENIKQYSEGVEATKVTYIITRPFFDLFINMGGSGGTLAALAAIFMFGKSKQTKELAKLATPAGVFNINEPVIFGLPIVLNPLMIIPFVLGPLVLVGTTYFAMSTGIVPRIVNMVPWTTPPVFSSWLATGGSISAVILQILNFVILTVIYLPFIVAVDRQALKIEQEASKSASAVSKKA